MNIFATDTCPTCAGDLDDLRLNKMITETAQLLSTAVAYRDYQYYGSDPRFMRPAYINHPCTVWTRASVHNIGWLCQYMAELKQAWGAQHKSLRVMYATEDWLEHAAPESAILDRRTPFVQCTPGIPEMKDVPKAYRMYMRRKWERDMRPPRWTRNNNKPEWYDG